MIHDKESSFIAKQTIESNLMDSIFISHIWKKMTKKNKEKDFKKRKKMKNKFKLNVRHAKRSKSKAETS